MPRILGVDIPNDKRTVISLRYIYGIGPFLAEQLCERTGIDPDKRARDLTEDELAKLAVAARQRVHRRRPAPPPGPAEHRPAPRHRLLPRPAAPQGPAGPRPADPDQRPDPQGPAQDGRRQEGRQGNALIRPLGRDGRPAIGRLASRSGRVVPRPRAIGRRELVVPAGHPASVGRQRRDRDVEIRSRLNRI